MEDTKLKAKAHDDKLIVQLLSYDEMSKGGIVVKTSNRKCAKAKVLATGEGRLLQNGDRVLPGVSPGDVVYFNEYAGTEIFLGGMHYTVISENDVIVVEHEE